MIAGIAVFLAGSLSASTIDIGTLLTNPSFESPTTFDVCPTSWICTGSPGPGLGVYAPTSAQYTPGADGLGGGLVVPNGSQAAFGPTIIEGGGDLSQQTATPWIAGDTYTFTFWMGLPLTEPNGTGSCPGNPTCSVYALPSLVQVYFTGNGVASSLPFFVITDGPSLGQWKQETLSFTAQSGEGYIGQNIGVDFHVVTSNNYQSVNFDIGDPVPEPSYTALLGLGLALLLLIRARSHRRRGSQA